MNVTCATLLLLLSFITIQAKILIIGAGPAGIAAATRLLENNVTDFLILEAENRTGGRISSIKFAAGVQDLGAQWCHGEVNNVVFELANPLGLLETSKYTYKNFTYINAKGELLPRPLLDKLFSHFHEFEELDQGPSNSTYGDYITKVYYDYVGQEEFQSLDGDLKSKILDLLELHLKSSDPCDSWFDLSVKYQSAYDELKGSQTVVWKSGTYQTILDVLSKKNPNPSQELPIKDKILLNKEIVEIDWNGIPIVRCKDGSEYKGNQVIFTPSLGVLKSQYKTLFNPQLPLHKIDAINAIGFGTVDKLIIEFSEQWWNPEDEYFAIIWSKLDQSSQVQFLLETHNWLKAIGGFHRYDYQPNALIGWIVGVPAREIENLNEIIVKDNVMKLIRLLLGKYYNISEPVNFVRTQWYANPHFRGSYSFNTMMMDKLNTSNAALMAPLLNHDNLEVIQFAGEATHTNRYGTVHGAIETGWREAERILKQEQKFVQKSK